MKIQSGFTSRQFSANAVETFKNVTSLTISNYGENEVTVIINDIARPIPAFNPQIGVPFGAFNLPGDGTACTIRIELKFAAGVSNVIIDYRSLKQDC